MFDVHSPARRCQPENAQYGGEPPVVADPARYRDVRVPLIMAELPGMVGQACESSGG